MTGICAILVSVAWLDRPITYCVNDVFGQYVIVRSFTGTPSFFSPLATVVLLVFIARRSLLCPFGRLDAALILADLSLILAKLVVPPLKVVSGRTWPQSHMPSLIGDGTYAFKFFQSGPSFESFPSGHTASICALFVVFWLWYPACWPIYTVAFVGMVAGLVVGNYHFLSDVVAGGVVGSAAAISAVSIYESWCAWRLSGAPARRCFRQQECGGPCMAESLAKAQQQLIQMANIRYNWWPRYCYCVGDAWTDLNAHRKAYSCHRRRRLSRIASM
jgi:membrane-associated phospholipid phosphatase